MEKSNRDMAKCSENGNDEMCSGGHQMDDNVALTVGKSSVCEEVLSAISGSLGITGSLNFDSLTVRNLEQTGITEVAGNVHHTGTSVSITAPKTVSTDKGSHSLAPKTSVNRPVIHHPFIVGNVNGANLLSAALLKKSDDVSSQMSTSSVSLNGQLVSIVPLIIQDSNTAQLQSAKQLTPDSTYALDSKKCGSRQSSHIHKTDTEKSIEINHLDNAARDNQDKSTLVDSDSAHKLHLSSSDTLIISTVPSGMVETLPASSLSRMNSESIVTKLLVSLSDKSTIPPSSEKPYSLLSNISDRSVSLESIPSIGLFRPDPEIFPSYSLVKTDSIQQGGNDSVASVPPSSYGSNLPSEIAIIGSNIPQSIFRLMKPERSNTIPGNGNVCTVVSSSQDVNQHPGHQTNTIQKLRTKMTEESNDDTDTSVHCEDNGDNVKGSRLIRSDTIILDTSEVSSVVEHASVMPSSDTVILPMEDKDGHKAERLSEGFSFNSFSTVSDDLPSLEVRVIEPEVSKAVSSPVQTSMSQTALGCSSNKVPLDHHNKTLYTWTGDGQLAILGYVSSDLAEITPRSQDMTTVLPQVQTSQMQALTNRNVDVKETQTELVFGTNTVFFRPMNASPQCSIYAVEHPSSTGLMDTLAVQSSAIPATVVFSENSLQLNQQQSSGKLPDARPDVSLTGAAILETMSARNAQITKQETSMPSQSSESELATAGPLIMMSPETSTTEDSILFSCIKCPEKFETKQDLISHERTHKKGFYKCDLCNATFTRMGNYNRHRKIHSLQHESQVTYKCNDCGREFLQRCDLKRHLLIHTKQEPHRCEKCGKGYIRRSDLVVHLRFHNKEKVFNCSLCDKKFFQSGDLNRHIRRAHKPNTQLTCGHCDRKYACETTLIRHMKAVHKDIILRTVNQRLQESDCGNKHPTVNTKDVLFTMTQRETDS